MHKKSALILFSAAALGLGFISALQAAADGKWQPYGNKNPITSSRSSWKCASTVTVGVNLLSQVCIIRSPNRASIQGAVIVRNNNTFLYTTYANVTVLNSRGDIFDTWYCPQSGVGAKSWSVCFGKTLSWKGLAYSYGRADGDWLGATGYK